MSFCETDWKPFDVLSGQLTIADITGDKVYLNAESGEWVSMCQYDDSNRITAIVALPLEMANRAKGNGVSPHCEHEHIDLEADSGMVYIVDRKLDGKVPENFDVPERKLNPKIVSAYGKPGDKCKKMSNRFDEICLHMAKDFDTGMPTLESMGYGTVCELNRGMLDVHVMYNDIRDAIGFRITERNQDGRE